jgi:hypothetical protein
LIGDVHLLIILTLLTDLIAMSTTLWLALYLFGRGYPSKVTLRAVIALLALSGFFFGAYNNLFHQVSGTAALRAILLIVGLASWYSLSVQLTPPITQRRLRWLEILVYTLAGITIVLLFSTRNIFIGEEGNVLFVGRMGLGLPYFLYSVFLVTASVGILYNLLTETRVGLETQTRFFLVASIFPIIEIGYGILALAITPPLPRLFQDLLIFLGIFFLGAFVARYQSLVERRTLLQDFPISGITLLGLSAIYTLFAWQWGIQVEMLAIVAGFAILTHSAYDLVREFLERQRIQNEGLFRQQLRKLDSEGEGEKALQQSLQEGLDLLCSTINASGGYIALREENKFVVTTTNLSVPLKTQIPVELIDCEDIYQPNSKKMPGTVWVAPAFDGTTQIAAIGISQPNTKLHYSSDELDLLAEVADRIGILIAASLTQSTPGDKSKEAQARGKEMVDTIRTNPDSRLVKEVEDALRNLHDYITIGQSPLAEWTAVDGESHIERGKNLQLILINAIRMLRPPGQRPAEPLPRVWYNYVVLHDAYVEDVPNREIMARLYISEGTFNRTRRNALRGLSRMLLETGKVDKG